jgi:hypothetical protein
MARLRGSSRSGDFRVDWEGRVGLAQPSVIAAALAARRWIRGRTFRLTFTGTRG